MSKFDKALFVSGTKRERLKGLYVVAWHSLRATSGGFGDRAMPREEAQKWADELNARPENKYLEHRIYPAWFLS